MYYISFCSLVKLDNILPVDYFEHEENVAPKDFLKLEEYQQNPENSFYFKAHHRRNNMFIKIYLNTANVICMSVNNINSHPYPYI